MEQVKNFFKEQNLYDESFFRDIKDRTHELPYDTPTEWFGVFPILDNDVLVDIEVVVPQIVTEHNLLVNLHEFYHAYELYQEIGKIYEDKTDTREANASRFEKAYVLSRKRKQNE